MQDFVPSTTFTRLLGTLSPERQNELYSLVRGLSGKARTLYKANPGRYGTLLTSICTQMEEAYARLSLPSTFRDIVHQVTCVQRHYLLTSAILTWYGEISTLTLGTQHPLRPDLMGAFTADPNQAQRLYQLGIPVWYMRFPHQLTKDDIIRSFVSMDRGDHIVTDDGIFGNAIFFGHVGSAPFFQAIAGAGKQYLDVEKTPLPKVLHAVHGPRLPRDLPARGTAGPPTDNQTSSLVTRRQPSSSRAQPCEYFYAIESQL